MNTDTAVSQPEYTWTQQLGYHFDFTRNIVWCMNCQSQVFLEHCPNDQCPNFGIIPAGWQPLNEYQEDK